MCIRDRGGNQFHFGKEIAVRFDECQVGGRELLLDDDGVVLGAGSIAPDARGQIVVIQIQSVGNGAQVLDLQGFAGQDEACLLYTSRCV